MRVLAILACVLTVSGCVTNHETYYAAYPQSPRALPYTGTPSLIMGSTPDDPEPAKKLIRSGLTPIGTSSFVSTSPDPVGARRLAEKLKAHTVLLQSAFSSTESGMTPVTTPTTTTTSYTGSNGRASTLTTTTNVTTYVPYSYTLYRVTSSYWVPRRPGGLAAILVDLSQDAKAANKTNMGVEVQTVITGGSAYFANILEGDIIVRINGQAVTTSNQLYTLFSPLYGQKHVPFDLLRDRKPLTKYVDLDEEYMCLPAIPGDRPVPCPPEPLPLAPATPEPEVPPTS